MCQWSTLESSGTSFRSVSEECAQELLQLLVELLVTIRGFSLAAAYIEEYKMSKQEHTKGKKGN